MVEQAGLYMSVNFIIMDFQTGFGFDVVEGRMLKKPQVGEV